MPAFKDDIRPEHQERWDKGIDSVESGDGSGAVFIYKALANDGCATALAQIGRIYEQGIRGVDQDFGEAVTWFKRSVETINDLQSHLSLARIYLQDKGLDESRSLAIYHLQLLARNEVMGGYYGLGLVHDFGIGVQEDKLEALNWYRKAELLGHVGARLHRLKLLFLEKPLQYFLPLMATSIKFRWLSFRRSHAERLEMWDDSDSSVFIES